MARLALFIDGGYLDRILKDEFGFAKISYRDFPQFVARKIDPDISILRSYYYHCPPYQSNPPTKEEAESFGSAQKFFNVLRRLPRFEVREGILARYGPNADGRYHYQQKRVDVLLSVDLVQLATKNAIDHAALIAGDSDFIPALNVARNEGVSIWLFHGQKVHNELWSCSDERIRFTQEMIDSILYTP